MTNKFQISISNKIKSQLFGILNLGHCDLPFDLAQGGGELVEPFGICLLFFDIKTQNMKYEGLITLQVLLKPPCRMGFFNCF